MSKFLQILFVACIAVTLCAAEAPQRFRSTRFQNAAQQRRNRFLARQEVAEEPTAVTPYPTANELKPEIPFEEVEQQSVDAELAPNQPDQTYGPPEVETDEVPAAEDEEVPVEPLANELPAVDQPTAEEEEIEATAAAEEEAEVQAERLVFGRRIGARKSVRPAKLRAAPKTTSARLQQQRLQQQRLQQQLLQQQVLAPQQPQQPVFFYAAPMQAW